jgi:hypothetical protein
MPQEQLVAKQSAHPDTVIAFLAKSAGKLSTYCNMNQENECNVNNSFKFMEYITSLAYFLQ